MILFLHRLSGLFPFLLPGLDAAHSLLEPAPDRGLVVLAGHHPLGILGKCRRDGVGLSRLEKQEIVLWAYFMERIVYIEFPGHPVKQAGVSL